MSFILAILGLCGAISITPLCWTIVIYSLLKAIIKVCNEKQKINAKHEEELKELFES